MEVEFPTHLSTKNQKRKNVPTKESSSNKRQKDLQDQSNQIKDRTKWDQLETPLSVPVLKTIQEEFKFEKMTPVQTTAIPLFMGNKDVAVEAITGSGKTLAFVVPIIEKLLRRETPLRKHDVGAIIIEPVRELAIQVQEVIDKFIKRLDQSNLSTLLLIGGNDFSEDVNRFAKNGGSIVIATPGRLEYFIDKCKSFNVKELEVLVLDEADRLLDMGFEISLNNILHKLPKQRRTGLFSATQTQEVNELIRAGMRNPVKVTIKVQNADGTDLQKIPRKLVNSYAVCDYEEKLTQLVSFLLSNKDMKIIVYFLTCACVDYFWKILTGLKELEGFPVISLHSKVPSKKRPITYKKFVDVKCGALLTTDLASRGLDIPDVHWIVQYDPPQDPDAFIHRIGRTARMDKNGSAIVYLYPHEDNYIDFLNLKRVPFTQTQKSTDISPDNLLNRIKTDMMKDRALFIKAQDAYLSYIRAYKEHKLNYIFQFKKLDLGKLATGFALLQIPKLKEFKGVTISNFTPTEIDLYSIPFKDQGLEKQRQEKIKRKSEKAKERKENKKNGKKDVAKPSPKKDNKNSKSKDEIDNEDEEDDLDDYKEMKKLDKQLAQGKITKEEYKRLVKKLDGLIDDEDDDDDD